MRGLVREVEVQGGYTLISEGHPGLRGVPRFHRSPLFTRGTLVQAGGIPSFKGEPYLRGVPWSKDVTLFERGTLL